MSAEFNPAFTPLYKLKQMAKQERLAMQEKHKAWKVARYAELSRQRQAAAEKRAAAEAQRVAEEARQAALQKVIEAAQAAEALGLRITLTVSQPGLPAAAAAGAPKRPLTWWQQHMKRVGTLLTANGVELGSNLRLLAQFCSQLSSASHQGKAWWDCWKTPGKYEAALPDAAILTLARTWNPEEGYVAFTARASCEIARAEVAAAGGAV